MTSVDIPAPPERARDDPSVFDEYLAELEEELRRAFESRERSNWARYVLGSDSGPAQPDPRSRLGALFAEPELPDLLEHWAGRVDEPRATALRRFAVRGARLAIDADPDVAAAAALVDGLEEGDDEALLAETLVSLFARKESLARSRGHRGYVHLALESEGLSVPLVGAEIDRVASEVERDALLGATAGSAADADALPDEMELYTRLRRFFSPLLDGVEVAISPAVCLWGFSAIVSWPDDVRVAARTCDDAAPVVDRVRTLGSVAHELGHALHYRLLAEFGAGFLDFAAVSAAEQETFADVGERLALDPELGLSPHARDVWRLDRCMSMRRQIGRTRFELRAYASAADAPASLETLWRRALERAGSTPGPGESWAREGFGFYTEDPLRRYAYPLAYGRARRLLATCERPLTGAGVVAALRARIRADGSVATWN